ncbi:MAG TPA: alpha/beta hydrolase [Acidimicrobiales bacterium]|nr:alpha/beta hydrolase [Acidimicrobiales bacterium]
MTLLEVDEARLEYHLARPPGSVRGRTRCGLVIAHGMPIGEDAASSAYLTFPELADRVARDTGWLALAFSFRGAGRSPGSFSPGAWRRDLDAAVALLRAETPSVFVAGFGLGGALALRAAAEHPDIGGAAALAAPADLNAAAGDPAALAECTAASGYRSPDEPVDLAAWAADLRAIDPAGAAHAIPPRPLLVVHGSIDPVVPVVDARVLSDAAEGGAELRVVAMAPHPLRHDPRAVAVLLGWLQRHG